MEMSSVKREAGCVEEAGICRGTAEWEGKGGRERGLKHGSGVWKWIQ